MTNNLSPKTNAEEKKDFEELKKLRPIISPIFDINCAINIGILKIYFLFNCFAIE